jgi:hypothetical protein
MKKRIKLTEQDLYRIVKRVIKETEEKETKGKYFTLGGFYFYTKDGDMYLADDSRGEFSENLMVKETKLITLKLLNTDEELKQNISTADMKMIIESTNNIFKDVVKKYEKSGKIIVEFELTKNDNNINVIVTDELETNIKTEFENRLKLENFPNTKKKSIKFIMLYIVNSINKF